MADIVFQPTFVHKEFVDGPDGDRVRAGEPNGFNARFGAIESDLRQLSTVVGEIDAAVDQRGTGPVEHVLTLPPTLMPVSGAINSWKITVGGAAQAVDKVVSGVMEVALPDNVRLVSFRAAGQGQGGIGTTGTAAISLARVPMPGGTPEELASMVGDTNPFDKTVAVDPAVATTATATFRYLIQATVGFTANPVTIAAFQIAYTSS
ncbi:hypothetical protein [Streptomyces xylophagus]|uniref:hypothetical protein n=1 Tax=Streptomyces xylophagus TaxID=285514 RepID=UPI0005B8F9AC|nr:hypothetical protein [Streptomyces xylophagus]